MKQALPAKHCHQSFTFTLLAFVGLALLQVATAWQAFAETLPSWNDGPAKAAIIDFVKRVTTANRPDFVPEAERIATFDNDGTLWGEQPAYFQLFFIFDRVKALAPRGCL